MAPLIAKGKKVPLPLPLIIGGVLTSDDWDVIINYINILLPIREATKMLKARGKSGLHGAIWEVIPTLDWLLNLFKEKKARVAKAIIEGYPN